MTILCTGERELSGWERELLEALVAVDDAGLLAEPIPHLVVSGGCGCCRTFHLRDTRRAEPGEGPSQYAEATTADHRWRFVLWTDEDGLPYCVEEATETTGPPPPLTTLQVRRTHRAPSVS